jgi:predicted nucleic acid-binding protein
MGLQNERELEELLNLFARGFNVLFTAKTPNLNVVENDPDDDKFIECAVALKSKFIISGDKGLREIENYMGIKIQSPKQFLDEYSNLKR